MTRIEKYATKIGADTFKGEGMDANRAWIKQAKADGKHVIDIGPHFDRRAERIKEGIRPDSPFYNMERGETKGYEGYEKMFERTGKNSGGSPEVD